MFHEIESDYCEETFGLEDSDLESLLKLYTNYMKKEGQEPECENIEEMVQSVSTFDHVVYHAEIFNEQEVSQILKEAKLS